MSSDVRIRERAIKLAAKAEGFHVEAVPSKGARERRDRAVEILAEAREARRSQPPDGGDVFVGTVPAAR